MTRGVQPKFFVTIITSTILLSTMSGCKNADAPVEAPPRSSEPAPTPSKLSILSTNIEMDRQALQHALEQAIPRTLWTINQKEPRCIPPQKVKILGARLNVTPAISCTIIGEVTRGPLRLRGEGQDIIADVPINAQINARDVAGILKGETATGSAMAHARIRLTLSPNWTPGGTISLSYGWTEAPGIDFLGQRIRFTDQADQKLAPIVRKLEQDLPRELARMNLRSKIEPLWRQSFTTLELNKKNPPVWMRVTPHRILYGGYDMRGNRMRVNLAMETLTETFVGNMPPPNKATALPNLTRAQTGNDFHIFVPVVANYAQLEPVIARALTKRSARPFDIPGLGAAMAQFHKVTAYGTDGGRIAVGLDLTVKSPEGNFNETNGRIWMTALPINQQNSAVVEFGNLIVTGGTDRIGGNILLKLGNSPGIAEMIAESLTQNFANDLDKLTDKIKRAISNQQQGDFLITANLGDMKTGRIAAFGEGLYLPVEASGRASVAYKPVRKK